MARIWRVGDKLEVMGDSDPNFVHSFSSASVIRVVPGEVLVKYDEFITDQGTPLTEAFAPGSLLLRPPLPSSLAHATLLDYKVGETVDAYDDDVWWWGLVGRAALPISPDSPSPFILVIRADTDQKVIEVKAAQSVRLGYEWDSQHIVWRRRVPRKNALLQLRILNAGDAETITMVLQSQPPLTREGMPIAAQPQPAETNAMAAAAASVPPRGLSMMELLGDDLPPGAALPQQALAFQPTNTYMPGGGIPGLGLQSSTLAALPPEALAGIRQALALVSPLGGLAVQAWQANMQQLLHAGGRLPTIALQAAMFVKNSMTSMNMPLAAPGSFTQMLANVLQNQGTAGAPRGARVPSAYAVSAATRTAHADGMRGENVKRDAMRALFLRQHLDKLRPFITHGVAASIEAKAAAAPANYHMPEPVTEQPPNIRGEMREYQIAGLAWLVRQHDHGINMILADEMGLGKTLQTIAFLAYLTYQRQVAGPHLVVVPLSVLPNWMLEFKKFAPDLRIVRIHVNDEGERRRLRTEVLSNPSSFDVAVTTYDMVNSVHFGEHIKRTIMWRYLILDEGHRVKNEDALISQGMRQVSRQSVIMLTGTPVQNNLHELYSLLSFMYPDIFITAEPFDRAFNLTQQRVDTKALEGAHQLLRPLMLRRIKDEIECKLPPKLETRINCPLSEFQTFWYRRLLLRDSDVLQNVEAAVATGRELTSEGKEGGGGGGGGGRGRKSAKDDEGGMPMAASANEGKSMQWTKLMNLLMQLRKVCNHPYLFSFDAEPDFDGTTGEDIVEASGKMHVLDRMLQKLKAKGHRVVLFSQFSRMLDILEDYIRFRGWRYKRLDGSTNRIQRMIDIQQFNKPRSDIFLYILCTRAGGLGVNLQTADTCILFDSDWNPQMDLQAMARVHRIGQDKPVHIYRLVTEGTVEERIQRRAESKLYLDKMVNRSHQQSGEEMEKMDKGEVLSMLKFGADRIFKNASGTQPSDAELDAIIDRSSLQAEMDAVEDKELAAAALAAGQPPPPPRASRPAPTSGVLTLPSASETGGGSSSLMVAASSAGGHASLGDNLIEGAQRSAAGFQATAPALSTFQFAGQDFKELRTQAQQLSLKEMAQQFWAGKKRERKERLIKVDGYDVLKENNYSMQQGGISVAITAAPQRKRRQVAGEDYLHCDFCQRCWDGGDLLCCDYCPVSMHAACLGMGDEEVAAVRKWSCPHHSCSVCARSTAASGGLLFRCESCENAYCEDHLPDDYEIMGECEHFQALGQIHPKQACFVLCSKHCIKTFEDLQPQLHEMMDKHTAERLAAEEEHRKTAAAAAAMGLTIQAPFAKAKVKPPRAAPGSSAAARGGRGKRTSTRSELEAANGAADDANDHKRGRGEEEGGPEVDDPVGMQGFNHTGQGGTIKEEATVEVKEESEEEEEEAFSASSSEGASDDDDDDFKPAGGAGRGKAGKRGRRG